MGVKPSQKGDVEHSAEHYQRRREKLVDRGTVKKPHSDSTKINMLGLTRKWTRHCELLGKDRLEHIKKSTKEDIMIFLEWMLDKYKKIRKRSTVHEYKRVFAMLYHAAVGRAIADKVNEELNDFINGDLRERYGLDTTPKEKPVMNVDDLFLVLHHHWVLDTSVFPDERQRLQLSLLLLLQAYTASRPGALVYTRTNRENLKMHDMENESGTESSIPDQAGLELAEVKTLCYRDVTILLLPSPGGRDVLAMEVTLRFTKGWERRPNPKTFILTEVDTLIFDAIMHMIVIGILDNAFEANIDSVDKVYRLSVLPPRRSYVFRWKKEWMDIPIFRQAVRTRDGYKTSKTEALHYHTYLYTLQRLGINAGFMQLLVSYMIRRGAGEAVEAVATQAQLQQVMNHRDAGTYQAYINSRVQCHVEAAFLGRPSNQALFKAVTHMNRYVDPRAPTGLTAEQVSELRLHPEMQKRQKLLDFLSQQVRSDSGTVTRAQAANTELYQLYQQAKKALDSARNALKNAAKRDARQHFFSNIDTLDINKQLQSATRELGSGFVDWEQPEVEHVLEERKKVADIICKDLSQLDKNAEVEHRVSAGDAMLSLCRRKEPQRKRMPAQRVQDGGQSPERLQDTRSCAKTQCCFCIRNGDHRHFSSVYKTRDHVEIHLATFDAGGEIPCPRPGCCKKLQGHIAFKAHAALMHNYDIFRRR